MNNSRIFFTFLLLCTTAFLLFCLDILLGSASISLREIIDVVTGRIGKEDPVSIIVLQSRMPKALAAIIAGAGLPVAGLLMQTYFRNPVAGPDMLGVSAGAGLFVAIVMLSAGSFISASIFSSYVIIIASVTGSVFVLLIILSVANKIKDSVTLLIFGLMFGMAISAVVGVLQYFSDKGALRLFMLWTFGSLGGVTWQQVMILLPVVAAGILFSFFISKQLNLLLLGENYAKALGLNIKISKNLIIIITAVLTGAVTAFCGPIAFIGIAVPHITRMILRTNDHFILIPAVALTGSCILLICDIIAQTPGNTGMLPLNSITAFMGAPFIIYIIWRNQHSKNYF